MTEIGTPGSDGACDAEVRTSRHADSFDSFDRPRHVDSTNS